MKYYCQYYLTFSNNFVTFSQGITSQTIWEKIKELKMKLILQEGLEVMDDGGDIQ